MKKVVYFDVSNVGDFRRRTDSKIGIIIMETLIYRNNT